MQTSFAGRVLPAATATLLALMLNVGLLLSACNTTPNNGEGNGTANGNATSNNGESTNGSSNASNTDNGSTNTNNGSSNTNTGNGNQGTANANANNGGGSATVQEIALPTPVLLHTVEGFATPESAIRDARKDVYLVSNIGTEPSPLAKDSDGFISIVNPDGTIQELKFIDGAAEGVTLNAPKGMALTDDYLWVADIDVVRRFDRDSGAPVDEIPVEGATFLNDLTEDGVGGVFLSDSGLTITHRGMEDSGTDAIYRITRDGKVMLVVKDTKLNNPNGLIVRGDELLVVAFQGKEMHRLRFDGTTIGVVTMPEGGLDGIVIDVQGNLFITCWDAECILGMSEREAGVGMVQSGITSPADLGYDTKRNAIIVPSFLDNTVLIYELRR